MNSKDWYQSRTAWVAILQSAAGFLTGLALLVKEGFTEQAMVAFGIGVKGLYDLRLRFQTNTAIK